MSCATASSVRNVSACKGNKTSSGNLFDGQTRNLSRDSFYKEPADSSWLMPHKFKGRLRSSASLTALVLPHCVVAERVECNKSLDSNIMVLKESLDGPFCCCLVSYYFSQSSCFLFNKQLLKCILVWFVLVLKGNSIICQWGTGHKSGICYPVITLL